MARVVSNWRRRCPEARDAAEVSTTLEHLAECLSDPQSARSWEPDPGAEMLLALRLLELLREEVVRAWESRPRPPSATAMLDLLSGFEGLRNSLESRAGPSLVTRNAGTVGPQLLVEVAHDLRSPLTSILFLSETILHGHSGDLTEVQHRQLGIIYTAALELVSMASDLIDFSLGGDSLSSGEPYPFSVSEMFREISDVVDPMAEERGVTVRVKPPVLDQRVGFPVPLSRILLNLTTNALKFTESGFVEITAVERDSRHVEFAVRDTGKGISNEAERQLYQPFRRTPGRAEFGFSGSGLGLAICRKLVTALGSELHHETQPGWGTRFYFVVALPAATPE